MASSESGRVGSCYPGVEPASVANLLQSPRTNVSVNNAKRREHSTVRTVHSLELGPRMLHESEATRMR